MKVLAFLCLILGIACLSLAASPSGYSHVISHLDKFQTPSGGFSQTEGGQPSLEATSHALFLSSLFGLRKKINPKEAAKYVASLENSDKGFGKSTNMATDVESTRHAVFSYHYLGSSVPNAAEIAKSLSRLRDPETGLFFSRTGEKGDLKSTALALQTLEILRENQRTWVQEGFDKIKAYLTKHAKVEVDRSYFSFPEEKSLGALSANYYGIVLGSYVGYDFTSPRKWATAIQSLQSKEGGFYTGFDKKSVSVEATSHAISSLRTLQQLQKDQHDVFVDAINTESLLQYVATVPSDLRAAAQAHLAVALTNSFSKNFDTSITYEVLRSTAPVGKQIVQGAQIKPVVSVKTHEGVPHAGLDIDVTVSYASQSNAVSAKLKWMDREYYSPDDFFDTNNQLGEMKFVYTIRTYVVGIGELSFEKTDIKLIGYGVVVDPKAVLEVTGKEFRPGETVAIGTDFSFSLTLQNQTHDSLTSGNFEVIFTVQDSSLVAIHTDRINCKGNTKPLKFAYSLKTSNIPSGELSFHFEVASTGGKTHTSEVVTYQLNIPMIATNILFDGFARGASPLYKIGQTVRVFFEPASFPDLRNVHAYSGVDVSKHPVADKRHLVMDLSSSSGARLRSVQGKARTESGHSKYVFEVPVAATLDSVGVNLVSFRYITAAGTPIGLANYDSALGELYEDASQLNFTVISELHMVDVKEQPQSHEYFYGHDINFRFRVKDALSGQYVDKGQEQANVYLLLKHKDETRGKTFTSAHEAAQQVTNEHGHKEYVIHWAINPNAVQGAGFLTLSAQGADGHHIDLYQADKKPVHFDVTIGGQITANSKTFSSSEANARETAFVVEFDLTCQNKSLKDAQLRVSVFRGDSATPIYSGLPVATSDAGHYSFALGAPHEEFPSGRYKFKFYREVDRKRALETRDLLEKKRLREELLKQTEEGTGATPVEESAKADVEGSLTPLFELAIYHVAPPTGKSPIRPEIIFALILGGVFIAISYQKKHYLPLK